MNIKYEQSLFHSSRNGYKPEGIVLHIMQGTLEGTVSWFKNKNNPHQTSAHYLVGRDGRVVQMVNESRAAHHTGVVDRPSQEAKRFLKRNWWGSYINPNFYTIGIECEGKSGTSTDIWTEPMMESIVQLTSDISTRHGILLDKVHFMDHQSVTSYKPDLNNWIEEALKRLGGTYEKMTYTFEGSPIVYLLSGKTLIPFATSWETYLKDFNDAKLIRLPAKMFNKFKVAKAVSIKNI